MVVLDRVPQMKSLRARPPLRWLAESKWFAGDKTRVGLTGDLLRTSRIKDVRKRRTPTPTAGGGADTSSFNPFAAQAPAPAANPAPAQSIGFSFGQTQNQSQSFPGASSGPAQGGLFSSGTNGQAGGQPSFSFGATAPSFGSQPASNPFSVNTSFGGDSQSGTNGFSFGGFNAGGAASQATSTPTPAPAPSFGGFGAQQNTTTPSSSLFGQSTSHITSPADESMQTSPDTKPKAGSVFAAKPAIGGSPLANPFSSLSSQSAGNPFAPKPAATDEAAKPAEPAPFKPLFGEAAASKPEESKTQPATTNLFAPKPAAEAAASNPFASLSGQTAGSSNLFAPKTASEQTPAKPAEAAKPFGALFGSTTTPKPAEPANNLFAPKPATETPTASNPFAGLSTPKVTESESAGKSAEAQPFKALFGTPAPSKTSDAEAKPSATPSFGNMFATPKPADESAGAKTSTEAAPSKSLFGTPAVSKPSEAGKDQPASPAFGNMFATPKPAAETVAPKPLFGAPVTSKPAETEKEGSSTPAKTQPFGSLFGASTSSASAKTGEEPAAPSNPFASLSGSNSFSGSFGPKSTEQNNKTQPSASPFESSTALKTGNESTPSMENNNAFLNNSNKFASSTFSSTPKEDAPPTTAPSSFSSIPSSSASTPTVHPYDASNTRTAQEADGLFPKHSTPPSIQFPDMSSVGKLNSPREDGDDPASSEMYLKLVMATTSFIRHVSQCNPETDNIDEAILFYAEIRRELGVPIGAIDREEEKTRANIRDTEAGEEAGATDQPTPARQPTPRSDAPSKSDAKAPNGASDTLSKFKQSFSAPNGPASPAPIGSSTPAKAPAAPLSFTPAAAPAIAAESSSATPAAFTPAIPKFGGDSTAPKSSTPAPAFAVPTFGGGSTGGIDFMAEFKAKAEKSAAEEKAKRKAEDFDSEDDDEAEWERKDAEKQREKRAKHEAAAGKRSVFVPGEGFKFVDAEPAAETPTSTPPTESASTTPAASQSLFGANTGSSSSFGGFSASPAPNSVFAAKPPAASASMFAPSSTSSSTSSVFGSSQPVPSSQNIFGGLKPNSPKRKTSTDAGSDSDDESPAKKSKASAPASASSSLFGRVSNPATPSLTPPATNPFGAVSPAAAPASPAAINPFGAPPISDKPTDTASETTSTGVAATEDGEGEPGEIFDLAKSNVGEEDESVEFEQKCRTFKLEKETSSWTPQGLGNLRLLKHPETGRARMVIRGDPNGNVILNTLLKKELDYSLTSNSVQLIVPEEGGSVCQYAVRVKKERLQACFDKIQEIRY